jgi:hypothetical protein
MIEIVRFAIDRQKLARKCQQLLRGIIEPPRGRCRRAGAGAGADLTSVGGPDAGCAVAQAFADALTTTLGRGGVCPAIGAAFDLAADMPTACHVGTKLISRDGSSAHSQAVERRIALLYRSGQSKSIGSLTIIGKTQTKNWARKEKEKTPERN